MKRYLLLLTFMAASFSAYSSTSVHPAFYGFMQRVGASSATVSFASNGVPTLVSSRHLGNTHIGAMGLTPGPNGVTLRSSGALKIPGTKGTIPIIATTVLSRSFLGRAVQIALPMSGLATTATIVNEVDHILNILGISRQGNNLSSNQVTYSARGDFGPWITGTNRLELCMQAMRNANLTERGFFWDIPGNPVICRFREFLPGQPGTAIIGETMSFRSPDPSPHNFRQYIPITLFPGNVTSQIITTQHLADRIALESGFPDSVLLSAVRIASNPLVAPELLPEKQRLPVYIEFPGGFQQMNITESEPLSITRTRVLPDGNIETQTETKTRIARINPTTQGTPFPTVDFEQKSVTTRKVITPTGDIVIPEETILTETSPQPLEQIVCGLPNTPPCRIYEPQSMPRPPLDDSVRTLETIRKDIDICLSDLSECFSLPDISFTFRLPSSCSSLSLPAFERWIQHIDICAYKPIFHSVMSMVWAITGVFGAIAIIGRRW